MQEVQCDRLQRHGISIDLSNILASTASISYTANNSNSGGILTVTDGGNTANISLNGQYSSADFHFAADQTNHVPVQLAAA